jgi:hypothetical protein
MNTNPGANPIVDLWMTIPKLSSNRLGYTQINNSFKIPFTENRMVL